MENRPLGTVLHGLMMQDKGVGGVYVNIPTVEFRRPVLYVRTDSKIDSISKAAISVQGWDIEEVECLQEARSIIDNQQYSVGLIQLVSAEPDQLRAVEALLTDCRTIEWVIITTTECLNERAFCKLVRETCHDYYTLPLSEVDYMRLLSTLGHAHGMASLCLDDQEQGYDEYEMVGSSPPMIKLFGSIRKVASVDAPILIYGESGTGKELIARAVHERSGRAEKPFIAVNCGAIPENLIQSELFGYEKGAFTGANTQKCGQIEAAAGGTLFLDEIGDLPFEMQVNLLRFLQEKSVQRLGGKAEIPVDVRVVAATNVDLDAAVKSGRFREDLLYRLNVLQLQPSPLRERAGDIQLMAQFFFDRFVSDGQAKLKGFSQASLQVMERYTWPGNVRELINRIRRAIVMCDGRLIKPDDLDLQSFSDDDVRPVMSLEEAREKAEKEAVISAIRYCHHNMTQTAKVLGVSRVTLYRIIEKYQLSFSQ